MKKLTYAILGILLLCGCHESLEKRAQREAREYTEKYCPTPVYNYTRTDSVAFDMSTKTYHYYCSVVNELDDKTVFENNKEKIAAALLQNINENTTFRQYKKAGFSFQWTLRSGKDKREIYFDRKFSPKDYNRL